MAYRDTVLADSPLDFYEMESSTGTDSGSGARTLTLSGGITTGVSGRPGNGWQFDGVNDSAATASFPSLTTNFSLEVWVKSDSNGSWTNDYNTFIRRDGTDIVLLRGRGSSIAGGVSPGKAEVYLAGSTIYSTNRIDDGNWHHLVLTVAGTSAILYVDGVNAGSVTTTKSTYNFGTGAAYLGSAGGTSEFFKGVMDNAAIYNTTLTSTKVGQHYTANAVPVNGGYTAQAATGSGLFVNPAVVARPRRITTRFDDTVNPFDSGSASTGDYVRTFTSSGYSVLTGFQFNTGGEMLYHIVTTSEGSNGTAGVRFGSTTASVNVGNDYWVRARHNGTEVQIKSWAGGTAEPSTWASFTGSPGTDASGSIYFTTAFSSTRTYTIDYFAANESTGVGFPDVAVAADVATANGLMVDSVVSLTRTVNITALAGTASAFMADPGFSNVTHRSFVATAAIGSGLALDPAVSLVRHVDVAAEAATGSGVMTAGSGYNSPVSVAAGVATGSGLALDGSVTVERNAAVPADPAIASAVLVAPLEAQNATDDPYYNEVFSTTDADDFWYRLDETTGTVIHDARGTAAQDADLFGDYSFGVFGPESRKALHMENGYAKRRAADYTDDSDTDRFAFEVVLRTTQKNGMLAYGIDRGNPDVVLGPLPNFRNSIYLKNGRVSTNWNVVGGTDSFELTGVTDVADGKWHHIVVAFNYGDSNSLNSGMRIYIDGKLDIRRRREIVPGLWASPDSYFGMPEAWRNVTPLYPWQQNLTGDVMEVVFRYRDELTQDQVIELYYAAFGIVPVRVQPATAVGQMPQPKVKGNQKRALVLYTKWYGSGNTGPLAGDERNAPSGYSTTIPDEFDHDIAIGRIYEPGESPWTDLAGFRVVPVSIMREDVAANAGPYRDPITDLPRLLNLQEDLNLDDYDLIVFRNWPDEGADEEVFRSRGYSNQAINDFLASVKKAVVDGKGLEVTNVNLASRLGLISGAQPIPMLVDKAGTDETDLRASMINPWDNDKLGGGYLDLHANNWHRVVAAISNLTDIADAEYISEAYLTFNPGTNGDVNNKWGYKLTDEPLQIGDELIDPAQFVNRIKTYTQEGPVTLRPWDKYVWAITPEGLSAGTAVYRFGSKMYVGNTAVDNPYRDFIGGAVVQPGDTWGGVRIAGKVFINLGEVPYEAARLGAMTRQLVPDNSQIQNPLDREDAAKREWDYSFSRVAFSATGGGAAATDQVVLVEQPDGSYKFAPKSGAPVGINIVEKFPTETVVVPTWAMRGLAWLAVTESIPTGSVVIRPTPASATGVLASPVTVAERSVQVNAQVALGQGVLRAPVEAHEPDVTVYPFPAEGSGAMTGYGKTITVEPFVGSGELVDNFELISARGEQVVVYLHRLSEVELFMEDK